MHFDQRRMGISISTQFMRSVEDRLLASIDIPSRHLEDSTLKFIPDNIESIPSYFRSYETSCASRLAYVVVMDAAERHTSVNEEEWRIDALAEELHKGWREFMARGKVNVKVNVRWSDLDLSWKLKYQQAAKSSLDALNESDERRRDAAAKALNASKALKASNASNASKDQHDQQLKATFKAKIDQEDQNLSDQIVEFLKEVHADIDIPIPYVKQKVRQAQTDRRANPYRWDLKGDCVRLANKVGSAHVSVSVNRAVEENQVVNRAVEIKMPSENYTWVQRHNFNTSTTIKWAKALPTSRVSIDEFWDAQITLGGTIEKSYRTVWEAIKDEPSIRRRFRPRSFLYEFVNQIAILETEAVLSKIHRENVFVPKKDDVDIDIDTNDKACHREWTFPIVVPHIWSVSLMDAAVRQALLVAKVLTLKREEGLSEYGVNEPVKNEFKSISFYQPNDDETNPKEPEPIDKVVLCFFSVDNKNKPYDVELTTRVLADELYKAYEQFDSTDVCRGKSDALKLAERLLEYRRPLSR